MIIINLNGKTNIESALKTLKSKFIKTKMPKELNERKSFTKKSVKRRDVVKKAKYIQNLKTRGED